MRRNLLLSAFVFFLLVLSVSPNFASSDNYVDIDEERQSLSTLNNMDFGTRADVGTEQMAERSDPNYEIKTAKDLYLEQIETKNIATLTNSIFDLLKSTPKENYWTDEANIIVTFESKENFIQPYFDEYEVDFFNTLPIAVMEVPIGAITEIQELPGVSYVFLDRYESFVSEWEVDLNGDFQAQTYGSEAIVGARDVQDLGYDGTGISIAIVDTGIDKNHPDLDDLDNNPATNDPKVIAEASFVDFDNDGVNDTGPEDWYGHGTHVAGIAAANGLLVGMAPGASLMNARVLDNNGGAEWSWIMKGIDWSATQGADIISMSLGGFFGDVIPMMNSAADAAYESGSLVVVSAGNSGSEDGTISSPGMSSRALTVGATDIYNDVIGFSSRGPSITGIVDPDIVAPGVDIFSTFPNGGYGVASGTSMSAPAISGIAALLMEATSENNDAVRAAMMATADDLGREVNTQGSGQVNALAALNFLQSPEVYAFPSFTANSVLSLSPGEKFDYQFDVYLNETMSSLVVDVSAALASDVTVAAIDVGNSGWLRYTVSVIMPASDVNGVITIKDGATTYYSADLYLEADGVADDAGSGTDAGETFSGAVNLVIDTAYTAIMGETDVYDIYSFSVTKGKSYQFTISDIIGGEIDLILHDENGSMFAISGMYSYYNESGEFEALSSGIYYARIMGSQYYYTDSDTEYSLNYKEVAGSGTSGDPLTLTGTITDTGVDENSNSLYDYLKISIEIDVAEAGYYDIFYSIAQDRADYSFPLYTFHSDYLWFYLDTGVQTIDMIIDGQSLASSGYDGAYVINDIVFFGESNSFYLYGTEFYSTKTYNHDDFEPGINEILDYTISDRDLDSSGNPEFMVLELEVDFTQTGYFYFDAYFLTKDQTQYVAGVYTNIEIDSPGIYTVEFEVVGQSLQGLGDIVLAGIYVSWIWSGIIPIFDTITEETLGNYDPVFDVSVSDSALDEDSNGKNDSIRIRFDIESKIDTYVDVYTSFMYSLTNESALPFGVGYGYDELTVGSNQIDIIIDMRIFNAHDLTGEFLLPNIQLSIWQYNFVHTIAAYVTDYYDVNSFDLPDVYFADFYGISTYETADDAGFEFTWEIYSSVSKTVYFEVSFSTYDTESGYFYNYIYEQITLTSGLQNITAQLSGVEFYRDRFIGIIEIEMASIRDPNQWDEMDFDYKVGLLKNVDYRDYLEFLPFYIKDISHVLVDEDENGKFDYLNIVINATVKRTGNYDFNMDLSSDFGYYYFYDYLDFNSAGNKTITIQIDDSDIVRRALYGNVYGGLSVWGVDWYDYTNFQLNLPEINAYEYELPLKDLTYVDDYGISTDTDPEFEILAIEFEVNITEANYYSVYMSLETTFEMDGWNYWVSIYSWNDLGYLSAGVQPIVIEFYTMDMSDLRWMSESLDGDTAFDLSVRQFEVNDNQGSFYLPFDEITLNTYTLSDFDFSLPITFLSAELDFEDQDEDGVGETLVIIVTVEVNEVLDITFNYYIQFSYNDNYDIISGFKNVSFEETGTQEVRIEIDLDNIFFDIPDDLEIYYNVDAYSDELGVWFGGITNWEEIDLASYVFTPKVTTTTTITEETTEDAFLNAPGIILIISSFSVAVLFRRKRL